MWWIQIPRRSSRCSICKLSFPSQSRFHTLLLEAKDETLLRSDFCPLCWEAHTEGAKIIGKWEGAVPEKKERVLEKLTTPSIISEIKELTQGETEENQKLAFLLSQHLLRKRALILRSETVQDGKTSLILEDRETEEIVVVEKFMPEDLTTENLQQAWLAGAE